MNNLFWITVILHFLLSSTMLFIVLFAENHLLTWQLTSVGSSSNYRACFKQPLNGSINLKGAFSIPHFFFMWQKDKSINHSISIHKCIVWKISLLLISKCKHFIYTVLIGLLHQNPALSPRISAFRCFKRHMQIQIWRAKFHLVPDCFGNMKRKVLEWLYWLNSRLLQTYCYRSAPYQQNNEVVF